MTDQLEDALSDAVAARMVADVPVGAFLSGGIDSSTIVALMQRHASAPSAPLRSDSPIVPSTSHPRRQQSPRTSGRTIRRSMSAMPRRSRSSRIWRTSGTSRLPTSPRSRPIWSAGWRAGTSPCRCRETAATSCSPDTTVTPGSIVCGAGPPSCRREPAGAPAPRWAVSRPAWSSRPARAARILPAGWQVRNPSTKVAKLARVLAASDPEDAYRALTTHWDAATSMVLGNQDRARPDGSRRSPVAGGGITEQMLWSDLVGYLPDDILVKLDRAAMAVSLETRVPFLDRGILDLAWRLPLDAKLRGGQTKWVLRQVLERHVPAALVERPKMGFGLPIGSWLRGVLAPWAEHLLDERTTAGPGAARPRPDSTGLGAPPRRPAGPGLRAVGRAGPAVVDGPMDARLEVGPLGAGMRRSRRTLLISLRRRPGSSSRNETPAPPV